MDGELKNSLVRLIRHKFASYPNVTILADDIVQNAFINLKKSKSYSPEKENYGYLSVVCIRLAYRQFMSQASDFEQVYLDAEGTSLIDDYDIAEEIIQAEDAQAVLESLKVLRDVERIVIHQRYYENFSFAEIARANGLNLNTVLSHHRRALDKLRPVFVKYFPYRIPKYHYGDHYGGNKNE